MRGRVLLLGEVPAAWAGALRDHGWAVLAGTTGRDAAGVSAAVVVAGAMPEGSRAFVIGWRNAGRSEPVGVIGEDLDAGLDGDGIAAWVEARESGAVAGRLRLGDALVDLGRQRVSRDGADTPLTAQEARLLAALARSPVPWSRDDLLAEVWGHTAAVVTRAVDNAVMRLRDKLEPDAAHPRFLLTERGLGYRLAGATVEAAEELAPVPLRTDVLGRSAEVAAVAEAFARGARLVTLVGPPGVGKTAIAASLPASWAATATTLAEALGDDPAAALRVRGTLPGRIDDGDDLRAWIEQMSEAAPRARFLVTARRPLRSRLETVVPVGPLPLDAARTWFLARAAALGEPVTEEVAREVVTALEGWPSAIEGAAARLRLLGDDYLERLEDPFALLPGVAAAFEAVTRGLPAEVRAAWKTVAAGRTGGAAVAAEMLADLADRGLVSGGEVPGLFGRWARERA